MGSGSDKRKFRRLEIRIQAQVACTEAKVLPFEATITNLGPEGAFCQAEECLPQGSAVQLSFDLAGLRRAVKADGEVRWVMDVPGRRGMGVQFTRISKVEKDTIYKYILLKIAESRGMV